MAATKNQKGDPTRFEGHGINFRAKLIGVDDVEEARGDKICQMAMQKLKAAVKASGEHKQKIVVNVSLEGLKIIDGVSLAIQYTHPVHRISFIARDMSDNRAFGYIFGVGDGTHKFFAIKTEKAAENLVLTLRDLFEVVYEMKKKEMEEAKKQQEESGEVESGDKEEQKSAEEGQESIYQDPPKRDSPEHVYTVPQNNAPVTPEEKSGSNLLDLEDQLESIELGIQQMSSFDTLMSGVNTANQTSTDPWGTPASTAPSASGTGLSDLHGLQSGFGTPNPFPQPGFGAAQPFGAPRAAIPGMTAPATNPFAPQLTIPGPGAAVQAHTKNSPPQPTTGLPITQDPFANDPFSTSQVRTPFPGTPAGFGATPGGFSQSGMPMAAPVVAPVLGQPPAMFGQPATAFPGAAPFPGVAVQPGVAQQQANFAGFPEEDPNILAPLVLGKEEAVEEPPPDKGKKDAFSDLVDIGGATDVKKTPKDMFAELNAPPKKSLLELQMEKLPGNVSPNRSPSPMVVPQASDPFGPLCKAMDGVQDLAATTADPFDTSHVHFPPPITKTSNSPPAIDTQALQANLPKAPQTVTPDTFRVNHKSSGTGDANPDKGLSGKCVLKLPNGTVHNYPDEFQLPSPQESPPPLPNTVKLNFPHSAPAPPPRPKYGTNAASARPRPKPRASVNSSLSLLTMSDSGKQVFPSSSSDSFIALRPENNTVHNGKDSLVPSASDNSASPTSTTDPVLASPTKITNSVHNDNDPFLPSASNNSAFSTTTSDPFLALSTKVANSVHNDSDPFLMNKVINSESGEDKWKAFGDFDSAAFPNESTVFTPNVKGSVTLKKTGLPIWRSICCSRTGQIGVWIHCMPK
ncbi:disabled homolog 1-like isoform X3 [Gigantopelta aegis]|uniref:disabled homolog 1-like isoform X3 n=1 Tax=Gigantopelta aegis TaxID=1735272 RepID=UPI001B889BA8|nr:disabled homolog 1-like isoform X3 [Gigantopelta aegis]